MATRLPKTAEGTLEIRRFYVPRLWRRHLEKLPDKCIHLRRNTAFASFPSSEMSKDAGSNWSPAPMANASTSGKDATIFLRRVNNVWIARAARAETTFLSDALGNGV